MGTAGCGRPERGCAPAEARRRSSPVSKTGGHVLTSTAADASLDFSNLEITWVVITQDDRLTCKHTHTQAQSHIKYSQSVTVDKNSAQPQPSLVPLFYYTSSFFSQLIYSLHSSSNPLPALTSTIIFTVGRVVAMFWGCGGLTVMGTQPAYRHP